MISTLRRTALLATAIAASCAALSAATPASALPPCCNAETVVTYYSDASHTTVVGHYYSGDCQEGQDGVSSAYHTTRNYFC